MSELPRSFAEFAQVHEGSGEGAERSLPRGLPSTVRQASEVHLLRQQVAMLEQDLRRARAATVELERRLTTATATLSFRLGYLLIHAPKSWAGLRSLPSELLALREEARRRRQKRNGSAPLGGSVGQESPLTSGSAALTERALRALVNDGLEAASQLVVGAPDSDSERAAALSQIAKAVRTTAPEQSAALAELAHRLEPTASRAKWLAFIKYERGALREPAALLSSLPTSFALKPSEKARATEIQGMAAVQASLPVVPAAAACEYDPVVGSCLYLCASALPYHVSGYTVRSHALVRAILQAGCDLTVALKPGYPGDRGIVAEPTDQSRPVDDIVYHQIGGAHSRRMAFHDFVRAAADGIERLARARKVELVHAASNYANALPALIAARRLGVPFVYEVRGLWELSAATRHQGWEGTERFELERKLETLVAKEADHVFTLTSALASELESRGVPRSQISIVPNSVDEERFAPREKDVELSRALGAFVQRFTLVYAGALVTYEGLDDLLRAIAQLKSEGLETSLLVVGDGDAKDSLHALASELCLDEYVKFVGKVAPPQIPRYWSLADAAAFPRKPFRVCELVSPLKPLEPMAMGIPVVVSDVPPLMEMVQGGELGLFHRAGDSRELASKLRQLLLDTAGRRGLGQRAREAVLQHRTWSATGRSVVESYRRLTLVSTRDLIQLPPGRTAMTPTEKAAFDATLERAYRRGGVGALRALALRQGKGRSGRLTAFCLLKASGVCLRAGDSGALDLAKVAVDLDETAATVRGLTRVLYAQGDVAGAAEMAERLVCLEGGAGEKDVELRREIKSKLALLLELAEERRKPRELAPEGRKSVYFLHFSLPYSSVGYATRSHGLIASIGRKGYDVRAYTRCGFPQDSRDDLAGAELPSVDVVDEVSYHRLVAAGRRGCTESEYLLKSADAYEAVLRRERPEVVHAASNYVTALPALLAARRLGLPFIYEIRGFWEITRTSRDRHFENSARFALMKQFEAHVARQSDHVFTLTSAMKDELVRRGVDERKISLVHNGVDERRFVPLARDAQLAEELRLPPEVPVIGYVGSLLDYEGLDDLVAACATLVRSGLNFRLLIVGDGAAMDMLRRLVDAEDLHQHVLLLGRVPHDRVHAYYSLMDICPFPRKPWEVCEMVSPLKPFEAMAMGKAVVVSSTHALREIVDDGRTGLVFEKGSADSLGSALRRLIDDPAFRAALAENGRAWTLQNRTWDHAAEAILAGYEKLRVPEEVA